MVIDARIPLQVQASQLGGLGEGIARGMQMGNQAKQLELREKQIENQNAIQNEQANFNRERASTLREERRLKSVVRGAAELNGLLENNDIKGAERYLMQRRKKIGEGIASGEEVDTIDTDEALQLLNENPEQLKKNTDTLVNFGYQTGVLKQPKGNSAPSSVKEFAFFNQLNPEQKSDFANFKQLGKSQTNINVDTAGNSFNKQFGRKNADQFFETREKAKQARDTLVASQEAREILKDGIRSGFAAGTINTVNKALRTLGFKVSTDPVKNTEAFIAQRTKEVGRIIQLFGAGTGLSDADREFATKAAGGDISLEPESIEKILDIGERAAKNVLTNFNNEASRIDPNLSPYPLVIDIPEIQVQEEVQEEVQPPQVQQNFKPNSASGLVMGKKWNLK